MFSCKLQNRVYLHVVLELSSYPLTSVLKLCLYTILELPTVKFQSRTLFFSGENNSKCEIHILCTSRCLMCLFVYIILYTLKLGHKIASFCLIQKTMTPPQNLLLCSRFRLMLSWLNRICDVSRELI